MNIDALKRPLGIDEVDFRVQSVNKGGYATILVYKDARADMIRLDEAVGVLGWKREHSNGNANCTVSLYNKDTDQWISKEDVGTVSNTEAVKGLASDSFKRACFNWGIGRELYDYPVISMKLLPNEFDAATKKPTWDFKLKEWTWFSQFDNEGNLVYIAAKDQNNKKRYSWGKYDPDLVEQKVEGKVSDSDPKEESPAVNESKDSNTEGFLKKNATAEEISTEKTVKEPTPEEVKWNELAQKYNIMFGKQPRANTKLETLEAKIAEETEKRAAAIAEKESEKVVEEVVEEKTRAIYTDSGEDLIMEEVIEEETPEKVEEVKEETDLGMYGGPMLDDANMISSFEDKEEFKAWAVDVFKRHAGKAPEEHIAEFKEACNKHFEKIG